MAQVAKDRYKMIMWKNVIPVYVCEVCGRNEDIEDEMILHVLKHEPDNKQEQILTKMLEKKQVETKPIKIKEIKEGANNGKNSINSTNTKNPVPGNNRRRR